MNIVYGVMLRKAENGDINVEGIGKYRSFCSGNTQFLDIPHCSEESLIKQGVERIRKVYEEKGNVVNEVIVRGRLETKVEIYS